MYLILTDKKIRALGKSLVGLSVSNTFLWMKNCWQEIPRSQLDFRKEELQIP